MPASSISPFAIPAGVAAVILAASAAGVMLTRFSRMTVALGGLGAAAAASQIAVVFALLRHGDEDASRWRALAAALIVVTAAAAYQFVVALLSVSVRRRVIAVLAWLSSLAVAFVAFFSDAAIRSAGGRAMIAMVAVTWILAATAELVEAQANAMATEKKRIGSLTVAIAVLSFIPVDLFTLSGEPPFAAGWLALLLSAAVIASVARTGGLTGVMSSLAPEEILRTMRDLLFVCDRNGRIRFANAAAFAFTGSAQEELVGRKLEDVLVPTGGAEVASLQGWVRDREYVFRTNLGQPIELTFSHSPLTRGGEVIGAVIIGRDLRDRKRYEWEARRAVTLLESTLDSTADGILVIGQDGRILTWNQRFVDMWGIPTELMSREEDDQLIELLVDRLVDPAAFLQTLSAMHEHPEAETVEVLELNDGRRLEQYSIGRYFDDAPLRVWSFRDVTARLAAEEALRESEARSRELFQQVEHQAYHDALTQLPNRRLFVDRLTLSLLAAKRARKSVAVLFIDLDRFKSINDSLGHSAADMLLVEVARRLRSCVSETDTVARHGGDEFTIILPDVREPQDAARVAAKILERIAEPILAGDTTIRGSASIGIAVYPQDGTDIDTLLRNADDAMYRAKQAGRNTWQLCTA